MYTRKEKACPVPIEEKVKYMYYPDMYYTPKVYIRFSKLFIFIIFFIITSSLSTLTLLLAQFLAG